MRCTKCGAFIDDDSRFCEMCGATVESGSGSSSTQQYPSDSEQSDQSQEEPVWDGQTSSLQAELSRNGNTSYSQVQQGSQPQSASQQNWQQSHSFPGRSAQMSWNQNRPSYMGSSEDQQSGSYGGRPGGMQPGPYNNPNYGGGKNTPSWLIPVIAGSSVLVIAAVIIVLFVSPGVLKKDDGTDTSAVSGNEVSWDEDKNKDDSNDKASSETDDSINSGKADGDRDKNKDSRSDENKNDDGKEETEDEDEPEVGKKREAVSEDEEKENDDINNVSDEEAAKMAEYYSTSGKPNINTFTWFTDSILPDMVDTIKADDEDKFNEVLDRLFGSDAVEITNPRLLEGGWKMLVVWDPGREVNSYCWDLQTADIKTDGKNSKVTIHSFFLIEPDNGQSTDFSGQPDYDYAGTYDGTKMELTSDIGNMSLSFFWMSEGRQYIYGLIESLDGINGFVLFQRP